MTFCHIYYFKFLSLWLYDSGSFILGEWRSRLGIAIRIGRYPAQTPLCTWPGLGTQPRYKAPSDLQVENEKNSN